MMWFVYFEDQYVGTVIAADCTLAVKAGREKFNLGTGHIEVKARLV